MMNGYDLIAHLIRQRKFSEKTFGGGIRTNGVCDHIRKELKEIEENPTDLEEWVDVILLALDGAWRSGHEPEEIVEMMDAKQTKNEKRDWPDWRTADPNKAIEHVRTDKEQLTSGESVPKDRSHTELKDNGQQKGYVVLTEDERKKGFVRPVRDSYIHKVCGVETTMGQKIAETYARDPSFYSGTFCCGCKKHLPLSEFVWSDTEETVGS